MDNKKQEINKELAKKFKDFATQCADFSTFYPKFCNELRPIINSKDKKLKDDKVVELLFFIKTISKYDFHNKKSRKKYLNNAICIVLLSFFNLGTVDDMIIIMAGITNISPDLHALMCNSFVFNVFYSVLDENRQYLTDKFFSIFDNIKDGPQFKNLKSLIEPISLLILLEYLTETLFTFREGDLSSKNFRKSSFEYRILLLLKKYNIIDYNVDDFLDIQVNFIVEQWVKYFNNKIQNEGIDSGTLARVLPYVLKDFAEGKTIKYLFSHRGLFKNFHLVFGKDSSIQKRFESLDNKTKNNDPTVTYTSNDTHSVIRLMNKESVKIIDSSFYLERWNNETCSFFNYISYQKNGTCYLNAALAFKIILDNYIKSVRKNRLESSKLTEEKILRRNEILADILKYLHDGVGEEQNILLKVSEELVKFYELLQHGKFVVDEYTQIPEQTPSSALIEVASQADMDKQKLEKQIQSKQMRLLKVEAQQLDIKYKDLAIKEKYLVRALEASNYKVQYVEADEQEAQNIKPVQANDSTDINNKNNNTSSMINKIIAKKEIKEQDRIIMIDKEVQTDKEKHVEQKEELQVKQPEHEKMLINDFFPTQKTNVVAYRDKNGKTVCIRLNIR